MKYLLFPSVLFSLFFGVLIPYHEASAATCRFTKNEQTLCVIYPQQDGIFNIPGIEAAFQQKGVAVGRQDTPTTFCTKACSTPGVAGCIYNETATQCEDSAGLPDNYAGPIPSCAFSETGCRDINSLIELAINVGKFIFSLIGSVAFIMFIYGGIIMTASFGNPEKFKQGQEILIAAITGVIISLSAYIAVDFLLDTLNVSSAFRAVQ